jgi:ParB family chromosome partitioning protein
MTNTLPNATNTPTRKKVSIDAPRGTHFFVQPEDITIIGLDTKDGPEHPLYDERMNRVLDDHEVANTIHYGVLKPVLAKKDGERIILIDGRSRVRRARAANKILAKRGEELIAVPVIIKKGDDAQVLGISRAANIHTADDPMTQARAASRLLDLGRSQSDVAVTFGVSEATVRNWLALLDLAPEITAQVSSGALPAHAALQLAQLPKAEQAKTLADAKAAAAESGSRMTVRDLKSTAREKAGKVASVTPGDRIKKAGAILRKLAATEGYWTNETLTETLDKVCKALGVAGSIDKLRDIVAAESEEK